jgi:hypothetical protein
MSNDTSGMLAARPGADPPNGGGGAGRSGGAGVSVGNYKGVMLCNRPFAGLLGPHGAGEHGRGIRKASGDQMPPFLPSGPHQNEAVGLNPIRTRPLVLDLLSKVKKDSANNQHRRFIKNLQKEKRKQKDEEMEEEKLREAKAAQFREKQRQMRQKVVAIMQQRVGGNQEECSEEKSPERKPRTDRNSTTQQCNEADGNLQAELERTLGAEQTKRSGGSKKPMWAMTSDAAEEQEEADVDDLVSFARSLDFEEFLSDLEVKTAMEAMQKRIRSLKRSQRSDNSESKYADGDEEDGEDSAAYEGKYGLDDVLGDISAEFLEAVQGRAAAIAGRNNSSQGSKRSEADDAEEARDTVGPGPSGTLRQWQSVADDGELSVADAKSIMSTASVQSMRSIHSTRSIAKLAKDAMKRIEAEEKVQEQQRQNPNAPPPKRVEIVLQPPRIVDVVEDGGARLSKKLNVNNLPYMHRNPSI